MNTFWLALAILSHAQVMYVDYDTVSGGLSFYNEGVMEVSVDYYDAMNLSTWCGFECRQANDIDGYIVVAHCNRVGSIAQLDVGTDSFTVLVADCIAQEHIVEGNIFSRGYIGEVDYDLSQELSVNYGTLSY